MITHLLLNLRQLVQEGPNSAAFTANLDGDLSFVDRQLDPRTSNIRFASFVGNMGENLEHEEAVPGPRSAELISGGQGHTSSTGSQSRTYLPIDNTHEAEALQTIVYAVGNEHGFQPLRDWFKALYEVLIGASEGPRFGGFVALYGVEETVRLIERALAGELAGAADAPA